MEKKIRDLRLGDKLYKTRIEFKNDFEYQCKEIRVTKLMEIEESGKIRINGYLRVSPSEAKTETFKYNNLSSEIDSYTDIYTTRKENINKIIEDIKTNAIIKETLTLLRNTHDSLKKINKLKQGSKNCKTKSKDFKIGGIISEGDEKWY